MNDMKFTNILGLPAVYVDWLVNDDYDHNYNPYTISATSLMKPIRGLILSVRHASELQQDVSNLVASKLGNAVHDSIARVVTPGVIKETRVERFLSIGNVTYTITGKFDILVDNGDETWTLRDIKTTSVWAYIFGGKDEDYRAQLSIYRWLLSPNKKVNDISYIDFFFTDWSTAKAKHDSQYPKQRLYPGHQIKLLSLQETEAYILSRLIQLEDSKNIPDNDLPYCTSEELWAEPEVFAVMKEGAKKATKLCDSMVEAVEYMRIKKVAGYIERRAPKVKRCSYCSAAPMCSQREELEKDGLLT